MSIYKSPAYANRMARRTDPAPSHAAARHMIDSGKLTDQQQKAFDLVKRFPGCTSDELAEKGDIDRYQLARRLPELERDGLVWKGDERVSTVGGRMGCTWHPRAS